MLLYQETLYKFESNASFSDRTNAPVRRGFHVCQHMSLSQLNDQGIQAFFETFHLALFSSAFWYPGDPAKYPVRCLRNKPSQLYPKTARNATCITLGTASSNFDSWEIDEDAGTIDEQKITGPKGLRNALTTMWDHNTSLTTISRSFAFSSNLLPPPEPICGQRKDSDVTRQPDDGADIMVMDTGVDDEEAEASLQAPEDSLKRPRTPEGSSHHPFIQ